MEDRRKTPAREGKTTVVGGKTTVRVPGGRRETTKRKIERGKADAQSLQCAPLIALARRRPSNRPLKQLERSNKNNHLQSNLPVHPRGSHDALLGSTDLHDLRSPS